MLGQFRLKQLFHSWAQALHTNGLFFCMHIHLYLPQMCKHLRRVKECEKKGMGTSKGTRSKFMHNYSLLHTKCLVFKSEIWTFRQDVRRCQPMCGDVCVIYGRLMLSGSGTAEIIYELIAIISKCQLRMQIHRKWTFHAWNFLRRPIKMNLLHRVDTGRADCDAVFLYLHFNLKFGFGLF